MPDFWEFPTVSMGLGPISAIYQARFNRYLQNRGQLDTSGSRVWAFLGDGETDEPESLGALDLAAREGLDNLTFVVNCNLQRLDGPVRGNGKIIQELEAVFRGAGWNVIKVIWAREWDELLARDVDGLLVQQMNETLDGEFQKFSVAGGGYIREHFFGPDPRLRKLVEHLTDDDLAKLRRGGHDYRKVYAAYKAATEYQGGPTVILAKTVKGWTLGSGRRGPQHHPPGQEAVREGAHDLPRPARAADPGRPPSRTRRTTTPARTRRRSSTCMERRKALGGPIPKRVIRSTPLPAPAPEVDAEFAGGSQTPVSTTMVFTRILRNLIRDKELGRASCRSSPTRPARSAWTRCSRRSASTPRSGQRYEPVDSDLVLSYREATDGQVLEEGITEAGSMASFQAAGTAYASHGRAMIPFYIFYSMFGFQRTGDQMWAFADARGRGFLMGATAGRTTLAGEGLQHDDGHTHVLASTVPNVRGYDPAFAYELAAIIRDGIEPDVRPEPRGRLLLHHAVQRELRPAGPAGGRDRRGHPARHLPVRGGARTSGATRIRRGSSARARSCTRSSRRRPCWPRSSGSRPRSTARRRSRCCAATPSRRSAGTDCTRTPRRPRVPHVQPILPPDGGPIIAATDWMKALPDMVARWLPTPYVSLGTDGFGRSDTRENLRALFEVDAAARRGGHGRHPGPLRRPCRPRRRPRRSASWASTLTSSTLSPSDPDPDPRAPAARGRDRLPSPRPDRVRRAGRACRADARRIRATPRLAR